MIKIIVTPDSQDLRITLPQSYVGKPIEVLIYSVDEVQQFPERKKMKPSDFAGTLSKEDAEKMSNYIQQSRNEWNLDL